MVQKERPVEAEALAGRELRALGEAFSAQRLVEPVHELGVRWARVGPKHVAERGRHRAPRRAVLTAGVGRRAAILTATEHLDIAEEVERIRLFLPATVEPCEREVEASAAVAAIHDCRKARSFAWEDCLGHRR